MRADVKREILHGVQIAIQERTRDQFGRAWATTSAAELAADVTREIERKIEDSLAMTPLQEAPEQVIFAKLQKAWWESVKLAIKTGKAHDGFRLFVRAMNVALQRKLF